MCTFSKPIRTILVLFAVCLFGQRAYAKYGGGSGTAEDPYQIATAADLLLLGDSPDDYEKHFILTADIDLDPNLPGRKVFDRAVIAPDTKPTTSVWYAGFQGTSFTGVFDGNRHTISNFRCTATDRDYVGLFGHVSDPNAQIKNLGLVEANVDASERYRVGSLVGCNSGGTIIQCYVEGGSVCAWSCVGGLVGWNEGLVIQCYSTGAVSGTGSDVGGLVGGNFGSVTHCYSTGAVSGPHGYGLVGFSRGQCDRLFLGHPDLRPDLE